MNRPLYEDGHLGPVSWTEPSFKTMARGFLAVILVPVAVALLAAAIIIHAPRCKPQSSATYVGGMLVEGCR